MQNLVHNDYCQCYLFISGKKMNYNGKKSNNLIFKKQFCNYPSLISERRRNYFNSYYSN